MNEPQDNSEKIQFLENKVQELQQQLKQQQKFTDLGKNIAYIIHEIRSPIGTIEGSNLILIQLIKNLFNQDELNNKPEKLIEITENNDRIKQSIKRINELIVSLNERVKSESKILVNCNLKQVIDDSLNMTLYSFRHRQDWYESVKINTDYDFNLTSIKLYRYDFERAISNLIENSLYSLKEKRQSNPDCSPKLSITAKYLDDKVELIIEDNGLGIKPEDESKIFDEFYTTKGNQGTGIGLFLVKQIIESQHNGTLTLETSYGDFARFMITL